MYRYVLALCLVLAACGPPRPPDAADATAGATDSPPIQTSSETYQVETTDDAVTLTIPLTYENSTGQTVYINRCRTPYSPSMQKQVDGEWVTVYSPPRLMCLEPPVVIDAGTRYDYVFEMHASFDSNMHPNLQVDRMPGTYRLVWEINSHYEPDQPATDLLPLEDRVSNAFEITE